MSLVTTLLTSQTTGANVGTVATGSTITSEVTDGYFHTTRIAVNTTLPAIAGGASLGIGKLLYTFPAGEIIVNAAYISMAITQTQAHINANTPVVGLGTTIASGAVSVLSGTTAFQNIIAGQTAANCTGTATVKTLGTQLIIPAASSHTVLFNAAAAWAASGDAAALLTGTVVLNWLFIA